MTEPVLLDDVFWDRVTREPPPILELMQLVWSGQQPPEMSEDYLRTRKNMEDDPKGFQTQLVGLERGYQLQVAEANKRDQRLRALQERVAELEEKVSAAPVSTAAKDAGEERVLDLIDRLRAEHNN